MPRKTKRSDQIDRQELKEFLRKDAEATAVQEWRPIGVAAMDTACLLISDPCYSLPYGEDSDEKDFEITDRKAVYDTMRDGDKETQHGQVKFTRGHVGAGVVVHSPHGDGSVTVYGKIDGLGRVRAVYFSFDGQPPVS